MRTHGKLRLVWLAPALLFALPALLGVGCPGDGDDPPVLDHAYQGSLELVYTQTDPPIESSVSLQVSVDVHGAMTFTPGTLSWDGEQTEDDVRLRRSGSVELRPTGHWEGDDGIDRFSVQEHGSGEERLEQWGWDGVQWVSMLDQTYPISWNGGLAFVLDDAVLSGSTVQANLGLGLARWTLRLTPVLEP